MPQSLTRGRVIRAALKLTAVAALCLGAAGCPSRPDLDDEGRARTQQQQQGAAPRPCADNFPTVGKKKRVPSHICAED
jgi:hypothetical protein